MRRIVPCVLMMTLLLAGCGSREEDPRQAAARLRGEYLNLDGWSSVVSITADYGERVYDFTVDARWRREGETVLTVISPELLAGITARIRNGEGALEYDGAGLSIGMLDGDGLTPDSAVPALMARITNGYMARCSWLEEDGSRILLVEYRDPERKEQEGAEYFLRFCPDTFALLEAEVSVDGVLRLKAVFDDFTMEMTENEAGYHADLG